MDEAERVERLVAHVRDNVIGDDTVMEGPYGPRRVTYADYTASGRALAFVEDAIREHVLPLYANTHTESSGTGLQTTRLREDARRLVGRACGADPEEHVVLFCGSGSTAAIDRLVTVLNLRVPADLDAAHHLSDHVPREDRPVVFIGPYEHHSNELPWRESICDVVVIPEDADGRIDVTALEAALAAHADRPRRIGSFSAASNVTGIVSDVATISRLLHQHDALAFWDFAAAGPYVAIDMHPDPDGDPLAYKDAVFLSPHKFIGGPGTPGVLVARRALFTNSVPSVPGGGTVSYVNPDEHRYLADVEHREEGGTPAIVESIRCGLVFQLKQAVGPAEIERREEQLVRRAIDRWCAHDRIEVLGNPRLPRLSIVSFVVQAPPEAGVGRYLHHNYVVALLNDLFGIQSRGGCSCAGPYGHRLLGIDLETSHQFERAITGGCEGIKPGWVRVNFNYFVQDEVVDFVLDAVELVADRGHLLLDQYRFSPDSGLWRHDGGLVQPPDSLFDVSYADGTFRWERDHATAPASDLAGYLDAAREVLDAAEAAAPRARHDATSPALNPDAEALRWFPLPTERLPVDARA